MNKVFLIGNLTKDPESSSTSGGVPVCRFTIAVSRNYTNAEGNKETDFLPVICWRSLAESCSKYLRKGNKACVFGSVQTRSFDGNDGVKRYVTEIIATDVEFLTPKQGGFDDVPLPPDEGAARPPKKKIELEPVSDDDLPF